MPEAELDLVLEKRAPLADGVVALTLCGAAGEELPAWEPGAHVDLLLTDDLVRQYSLPGDPADRSALRVAVLCEPDGRGGSSHVHDVLAEGDTAPACREGTCGTCETGVLDGEPDHRDAVLAPGEQAANDVMMICVSRSRTPRLVLDL